MIEKWSAFEVPENLVDLALSNDKNSKIQEISVKYLLLWWETHHPVKKEEGCQMEKERERLLTKLPPFMKSHSPFVKE